MRWEPLLDGDLADHATRAARDIAHEIATVSHGDATPAERTLYWAYTSSVVDEPWAAAAYDAALDELVDELQRGALHPALYNNGLAGMGWVLGHVLDQDASDALEVIDEALVRVVSVDPWRGHHDLAQGLVGYGVYFLERLASSPAGSAPIALRGLHETVRHLDQLATRSDLGATWLTPVELLPEHYHQAWPDGHFDCGLAHGVAGAIAFLARAAGVPDAPPRARPLCDEAVRWLAAQRLSPDPSGRFPGMTYTGAANDDRTRAAWCYGDPGVASALWIATGLDGTAGAVARETAHDCSRRSPETAGILDSGLCHGACGLAHILNRFYQASGEAAHADAARAWFARALEMRGDGGIAGFTAWRGKDEGYQPIANILEGALGVGLSLLAAVTPNAPNWDRMMLVDVPAKGAA